MCKTKARIEQIRYNATEQCFEALVTLQAETGAMRIPCQLAAPITAEFDEVAEGLTREALRLANAQNAMKSRMKMVPPRRAEAQQQAHPLPFAA